jgi:hypothetical protein
VRHRWPQIVAPVRVLAAGAEALRQIGLARHWLILLILVAGVALRIAVGRMEGNRGDMAQFQEWVEAGGQDGFAAVYAKTGCNYPPGTALIMGALGKVREAFPVLKSVGWNWLTLKLPSLTSDLLVGLLIYLLLAGNHGQGKAALLSALYIFNPAVVTDSASWGQTDGMAPVFPLLALYLLERKAWLYVLPAAIAGLTIKFQAIALSAAFVPWLLADAGTRRTLKSLGLAALTFLFICSPFLFSSVGLVGVLKRGYLDNLGLQPVASLSALNLWEVVPPFFRNDTTVILGLGRFSVTPRLFGFCLAAIAWSASVLSGCWRRELTARAYALGMAAWAFFMFSTEMHERYLLPAVSFFTAAAPSGMLASLGVGVVSLIHLYSCYFGSSVLTDILRPTLLPLYFVFFWGLRSIGSSADGAASSIVDRPVQLLAKVTEWVRRHFAAVTAGLAGLTAIAVVASSGILLALGERRPLTSLWPLNPQDITPLSKAEDGPLRAAREGFQTAANATIRFPLPPYFSLLRVRVGIGPQKTGELHAGCTASFVVATEGRILKRIDGITPRLEPVSMEIPLVETDGLLRLWAEALGCGENARFQWISPELLQWRAMAKEDSRKTLYLSDLRSFSLFGWISNAGLWRLDRGVTGGQLTIAGRPYERGIGVHADSKLVFEVPPGFSRFVTDIGYETGISTTHKLRFAVEVDGEKAFVSRPIAAGEVQTGVTVPVGGARKIILIAEAIGNNDSAHANWADARFER